MFWMFEQLLIETSETESSPEQVSHLVSSIIQEDFLYSLARSVHLLPFESRKDTQSIFSYVLRHRSPSNPNADPPALQYVVYQRPEVLIALCRGYEQKESAMPCGMVLREALKHESVTATILYDQSGPGERVAKIDDIDFDAKQSGEGVVWQFFSWIDNGAFEVSTDAFTTFRVSLYTARSLMGTRLSDAGIVDETQTTRRPLPQHQF